MQRRYCISHIFWISHTDVIHSEKPSQLALIKLSSYAKKLRVSMCLYRLQYGETKVHFCSWCWQCLSRPHPPPPLSTPSASALTGSLCQHLSPDNQWLLDYIWRPTALAWSQVWFPSWQSASHLMAEKQELSLSHTHTHTHNCIPHGSWPATNKNT